ncbi:MAG TPA: cation transporter, partial [Solirubrobacteraceae bacterium]|nr:cation transporter [Solirubrobacteraceae bacterium]
ALLLSWVSVGFGGLSGALSVVIGVLDHSLGVLAAGLAVLADLGGSGVLIWRFQAERRHPVHADRAEHAAAIAVSGALAVMSAVLAVESIRALLAGSHPGASPAALAVAALALLVLAPLAYLKRATGIALASRALTGDGTLSAIGAGTALLALVGLLLYRWLGWGSADRLAALLIAVMAAVEARTVARSLRS